MTGIGAYDLAIVLGSGWREGAAPWAFEQRDSRVVAERFRRAHGRRSQRPTPLGTRGREERLLVAGRVHLYEGNTADQVVHPVRTAIAAGAQ